MPEANEEVKSEATAPADSADASTVPAPEDHGIEVDDKVDVSDSALAQARLAAGEATEEVNEKSDTEVKSDDSADVAESASTELDEISEAILKSLEPSEPEVKRTQTPEEKIKELERKLNKALEKSPVEPADAPKSQEQTEAEKEAYAQWVRDTYDMDMDEFKRRMMFQNDYFRDIIQPQINEIKQLLNKDTIKAQLGKDALYTKLQKDVEDIVKNDPIISSHPDEKARYQLALLKAKDKNMPAVIAAIKKKEAAKAQANKRIIPTDRSTANAPKPSGSVIPDATMRLNMKRMGLSEGDLEKYKGKLTLD